MQGPTVAEVADSRRKLALEQAAAAEVAPNGEQLSGRGSFATPHTLGTGDPYLPGRLAAWAKAAPTLPAGALLSVARGGISPDSPVGTYLLQNAVPALLYKPVSSAMNTAAGSSGLVGSEQSSLLGDRYSLAEQLVSDPDRLDAMQRLPLDQLTHVIAQPINVTGNLNAGQITTLGATGQLPEQVPGAVRELGAVAQSGAEALGMGIKQQAAGLAQSVANVAHGEAPTAHKTGGGVPYDPQAYQTPTIPVPNVASIPGLNELPGIKNNPLAQPSHVGGTPITFGDEQALTDPGQLTVVQQARGFSLGSGLLPGGEAVAHAQAAQRAAATVAGSALTPGRALAAFVTTPDSLAYKAVSGITDAYVALHADPALLVGGEITNAIKNANKVGTITNDAVDVIANHLVDNAQSGTAVQALRDWAGVTPAAEPDLTAAIAAKIRSDPVSVRALYDDPNVPATAESVAKAIVGDQAGLLSGLTQSVHPDRLDSFLLGPKGDQWAQQMADRGFTEIGRGTKWSLDAKLHAALAAANTPDEARAALVAHLETIKTLPPTIGFHPVANMRWSSIIPTDWADVNNADSMLPRAIQDLQIFKVPHAEWDKYLPNVVHAEGDYQKAFDAFTAIGDRNAQEVTRRIPGYTNLVDTQKSLKAQIAGWRRGPSAQLDALTDELDRVSANIRTHDSLARDLTNYFYQKGNDSRIWHNDEIHGGSHVVSGLAPTPDGMTAIEGPFGASELLSRAIGPPGGGGQDASRAIQRAVGKWAPLFNSPVIGALPRASRALLVDTIGDNLTNYMKSFAMMHVGTGLRIIGSQGARMAIAGVGDLSENPTGLLGLIAGRPSNGLTAEEFLADIGHEQNRLAAAIGRATDWKQELGGAMKGTSQGWTTYDTATRDGVDAWANRLSHTSNEPVARAVADALNLGVPLDEVKQSVWDGPLSESRRQMIDANVTWGHGDYTGYSRDLASRDKSDAWVEAWSKIVQGETASHPELLQAVADNTIGPDITDKFRRQLARLAEDGIAPSRVTGPIKIVGTQQENLARRAMSAVLSVTAETPTREWMMIPTAKKVYFNEIQRMLPYLNGPDTEAMQALADKYGFRLTDVPKSAVHTADLNTVNQIAKTHAAAEFGKIFYNPGKRPILIDQLRDLIPFANVIREHGQAFARLIAQNPKVLRVAQMGVTSAEQSGWWTKDQYGKQQMTMVPGVALNNIFGIGPSNLTGEASRLNIATQGWPSVGPIIQWTAPAMLDKFNQTPFLSSLRHFINPYGEPDFTSGGVIDQLFPGWVDKYRTSGWFAKTPLLNTFLTPSHQQDMILNHVAMQQMRQLMATGHYDMSDPNVMSHVWDTAMHQAQVMYLIRGTAQFASPIAPQFDNQVPLKDGSTIQQYLIANDFNAMKKAAGGDEYKAMQTFVDKYGPDQIFGVQPFTRPLTYGLPTTAEAEAWAGSHRPFVRQYGSVYGYFTPQGGVFDYNTYLQQIADGTREALTGPKWYQLAEARLGNIAWDQFRKALPANLNSQQQALADVYKTQLTKQFPGFNQDGLKIAKDTAPQTIAQFRGAIRDPAVKNTPLALTIDDYFQVRDAALAKQKSLGLSDKQVSTSPDMAPLRELLFRYGQQLSTQHPEFANVWQHVFSYEADNQQTSALATAAP